MAVFADAVCRCSLEATSYCSPPSRGRLRRIAPPSHCKDRLSQRSPHVTALQAQSELPVKRGAWAAAATQTVQAAFVRWLVCGRLRSLYTFSTGNRSGSSFVVAIFAGFDFVVRFPMLRQPQQFSRLHLNQREHLAALGDQCVVSWTRDAECAPEPRALHVIQPALNYQPVAQSGCASIIDLGADHDGIGFLLRHRHDREPALIRNMRARYVKEPQVRLRSPDSLFLQVQPSRLASLWARRKIRWPVKAETQCHRMQWPCSPLPLILIREKVGRYWLCAPPAIPNGKIAMTLSIS